MMLKAAFFLALVFAVLFLPMPAMAWTAASHAPATDNTFCRAWQRSTYDSNVSLGMVSCDDKNMTVVFKAEIRSGSTMDRNYPFSVANKDAKALVSSIDVKKADMPKTFRVSFTKEQLKDGMTVKFGSATETWTYATADSCDYANEAGGGFDGCTNTYDNDWSTYNVVSGGSSVNGGWVYQNWTVSGGTPLNMTALIMAKGGNSDSFFAPQCWNSTDWEFLPTTDMTGFAGDINCQDGTNIFSNPPQFCRYYMYNHLGNGTAMLPLTCYAGGLVSLRLYGEKYSSSYVRIYESELFYEEAPPPVVPLTWFNAVNVSNSTALNLSAEWFGTESPAVDNAKLEANFSGLGFLNYTDGVIFGNTTRFIRPLTANGTYAWRIHGFQADGRYNWTDWFTVDFVYSAPVSPVVLANHSCHDAHTQVSFVTMNVGGNLTTITTPLYCDNGCNAATGYCSDPQWYRLLTFGIIILAIFVIAWLVWRYV